MFLKSIEFYYTDMFKTLASNSRIVTYVKDNTKHYLHVDVRVLGFRLQIYVF